MKITFTENDGCFAFNMEAENMKDAALLVRFATNATNDIRTKNTTAGTDDGFDAYCVIGKHRKANTYVQRRR